MNYQVFLDWCSKLLNGASQLGEWLSTPLTFGSVTVTPLILISITGLIIFIGLAIIKWVVS